MAKNEAENSGQRKQHDDAQGGGGSKGGGGQTKHAEGTKSEASQNERTGSRTDEQRRN